MDPAGIVPKSGPRLAWKHLPAALNATLVRYSNHAVFLVDAQGIVHEANPAASLQWPSSPWPGRSLFELLSPQEQALTRAVLVGSGPAGRRKTSVLAADGTLSGVRLHWFPFAMRDVRGTLVVLQRDRPAKRPTLVLEALGLGSAMFDPSCRVVRINRRGRQSTGVVGRSCVGCTPEQLFGPHRGSRMRAQLEQVFVSRRQAVVETSVPSPAGERWFRSFYLPVIAPDGTLEGVQLLVQEFSKDRSREDGLLALRRRYLALFDQSGSATILFDPECRLILWNSLARAAPGVRSDAAVGSPVEEVFGARGAELRAALETTLRTGVPTTVVHSLSHETEDQWWETLCVLLTNPHGGIEGVQVIERDVTEKHRLAEQAVRNQRLESLGVVAGGIAHDFNNILAALTGNVDLARLHLRADRSEAATEKLLRAQELVDRAKGLTRKILTFSRGGTPVRRLHDLGPWIDHWVASLQTPAQSIALTREDLWAVSCDLPQVQLAVTALLTNALEASPAGHVWVRARNVPRPPSVAIEVHDDGPGIAPSLRTKIFDPFFTTKTARPGLGLTTAQSIARQHDGWIDVRSFQGEETVVTLVLPTHPGALEAPTPSAAAPPITGRRVLILDDEGPLRETLVETLTLLGYHADAVAEGLQALEAHTRAKETGSPYAIVFLDRTIPGGMGGLETARQLRSQGSHAFLVSMSGYAAEGESVSDETFHAFLEKPFPVERLLAVLASFQDPHP